MSSNESEGVLWVVWGGCGMSPTLGYGSFRGSWHTLSRMHERAHMLCTALSVVVTVVVVVAVDVLADVLIG